MPLDHPIFFRGESVPESGADLNTQNKISRKILSGLNYMLQYVYRRHTVKR